MKNKVLVNPKYKALGNKKTRYFILTGGRGSGKSFAVAAFLALLMREEGHTILYTRYTAKSIEKSIIPEFLSKIKKLNIEHEFYTTKNSIVHKYTKSKILFAGIKAADGDQVANLKSLEGVTTWVMEEAQELTSPEKFRDINLSVRQKGKQNRVILLLNPTTKNHWIYERFFAESGVEPGHCLAKDKTTYIHTTYMDVEKHLDEEFMDEMSSMKEHNFNEYQNVVLGGWLDKAEGVVFNNWEIGEFKNCGQVIYGQDFGYTNDPSTLVKLSFDVPRKIMYVEEMFYLRKELGSDELISLNKQYAGAGLIIAESADPRLTDAIKRGGLNIKRVVKEPIVNGIKQMKEFKMVVSPDSKNIIRELNTYVWLDKGSSVVAKGSDHAIDAIRYVVLTLFKGTNTSLADRFK